MSRTPDMTSDQLKLIGVKEAIKWLPDRISKAKERGDLAKAQKLQESLEDAKEELRKMDSVKYPSEKTIDGYINNIDAKFLKEEWADKQRSADGFRDAISSLRVGGDKRKSRKPIKSRKSRKSRKPRKSRKSRKPIKSRKSRKPRKSRKRR